MANANPFHATTTGDPRSQIRNPVPITNGGRGLQISIEEAGFVEAFNNFREDNPDFSHYENGHPEHLGRDWQRIQAIRDRILNSEGAAPFRAHMKQHIAKAGTIRNAVCVGLGHPHRDGTVTRIRWGHQLAAFLAICKMIEEVKGITLPTPVYADPCFNIVAEYFIETLAGHRVVKDALDGTHVDEQSFVYGIHLAHPAVAEGVLRAGKHPELFIGPRISTSHGGVSFAICRMYIKNAYTKRTLAMPPHIQAMMDQALLFQSTHDEFGATFDYYSPEVHNAHFNGTSIFVRRKEPLDLKKMMDPTKDKVPGVDGKSDGGKTAEGSKDLPAKGLPPHKSYPARPK